MVTVEERRVINLETEIDIYPLLYIKDNKNLRYSAGTSVQDSAVTYMGLESRREWICVLWIVDSLYSRKHYKTNIHEF